ELELHAVERERVPGRGDGLGGRDHRDVPLRGRLAEPGVDLAVDGAREAGAGHVEATTPHRGTGDDVLPDGRLEEAVGRDDADAAGAHVVERRDAFDAAEVV